MADLGEKALEPGLGSRTNRTDSLALTHPGPEVAEGLHRAP
jgi:hypothetical protein